MIEVFSRYENTAEIVDLLSTLAFIEGERKSKKESIPSNAEIALKLYIESMAKKAGFDTISAYELVMAVYRHNRKIHPAWMDNTLTPRQCTIIAKAL